MLPTTPYTPLPLDGSLDIFQAFEFQSTKNPDHALFRYDSESASEGYEEISWSRAVKMFDTTAQILRHRLPETDYTRPPVVGILAATSSIPYAALVFGALRAGCIVFPLSTRNSDVATAHLIAESGIRYLLVSSDGHMQEIARKATALLKARSLHVDITPIPTYEEIFTTQGADLDALPPAPPIDDERIILIAHSSGSTSFPKVIPLTQRYLQSMVQAVGGSDLSSEVRSAQASAMFHAAGFVAIARAAYTGMTLAFFPPTTNAEIPTPERVLGSALATKCTTLGCSPVFLEHWVKSPADVNKLRTFSCVLFGGGPLAQVVGDTLEADDVNLLAVYGSTETGGISAVKKHGGGWQYFEFLPTTLPVLVPVDGDPSESLFQLIIKDCTTNRLAVSNMEIDGFPAFDTKDIVQQHPTNPKLYRVYARVDDQIMHSNGEKTNPGPLEEILVQNSLIKAAIFFGRLKPHAGVLVTPSENAVNLELFRDAIWPTVEQANKFAPAHSRLFKNMIILSDPSKPFQVTAKGTLRRNAILEDYAQEIEDAYADFDSTSSSFSTVGFVSEISMKATLEIVRGHVHANIRSDISDEEDIFEAGGDSLLAARIRAGIIQSLRGPALKTPDTIMQFLPQDLVFTSPTISSLSACIYELITRDAQDHALKNTRHEAVSVSILDQKDHTIVRLCDSGDTPLILVHGGSGDVYCYRYMQARFKTGLWAIQVTKDTPRTSFIAQTDFYYQKIKESQPRGPYRIGGYSAGTFMACRIAILLEENGDEVVQLALIDSSPFMHFFPHPEVDEFINFNDPRSLHDYYDRSVRNYCKVALTWEPWWHKFSEIIWERWNDRVRDEDMPELMANAYHNLFDGLPRTFDFMLSLTAGDPKGYKELIAALVGWMKELRAPVILYKASNGAASKVPPELREKWKAFGMDWGCKNVRVVEVEGDHGTILNSDKLFDAMQFNGQGK
ncbi:hypothetical protein C8F04DRAFT_996222 [Mycena alexandri]|uniref:Carrier domain-containing protein n=1 Tax=Mycena alexandri TaxID=1745969 RepID=A0AAD6T4U1_9AGAR|nr:hypothetical protein C8F04DRAFT_996222 [Mycena alexandri]